MTESYRSSAKLLQKLILTLCFSTPFFAPAQSALYSNRANHKIVQTECGDRVFTKVEVAPLVQEGLNALADSLTGYLREKKVSVKGKAILSFLVTKSSAVIGIENLAGRLSSEKTMKEALTAYSSMWTPALQNKHKVCAIVHLEVESEKEKIILQIVP